MSGWTLSGGEQVLGRYIVERPLGRGGMGEVYVARHKRLGMLVAIKVLNSFCDVSVPRFEQEAQLMARVLHPNVASVVDYGTVGEGYPCIVIEFVEGPTLSRFCQGRAQPWRLAVEIADGILLGLGAMHAEKILHRDLKPGNIVLFPGPPRIAKLIDFGIARPLSELSSRLTMTGVVMGTPAYMAPEQLDGGQLDERSDLYSVGLMLYEMFTGMIPHVEAGQVNWRERLTQLPPFAEIAPGLPPIPEQLQLACAKALEPMARDRPATAGEFRRLLEFSEQTATGAALGSAPDGPVPALMPVGVGVLDPISGSPASAADQSVGPIRLPATEKVQREPGELDDLITPAPQSESLGSAVLESVVAKAISERILFAAGLPASRLRDPVDRKWLGQRVSRFGRAYTFGPAAWVAVLSGRDVEVIALELTADLEARFGAACATGWERVAEDFTISVSSLSGAAPLPEVMSTLLEGVLHKS